MAESYCTSLMSGLLSCLLLLQGSAAQPIPTWVTDNIIPSSNKLTCGSDLTATMEVLRSQLQLLEQQISQLCRQTACPPHYVKLDGGCYRFSRMTAAWHSARKVCQIEGSDLVSFQSAEEETRVKNYITNNRDWPDYESRFWTSGNEIDRKGDWRWGTGTTSETMGYTNFSPGEPNDHYGQSEECVEFNTSGDRGWNDAPCHFLFNYICEQVYVKDGDRTETPSPLEKLKTTESTTTPTTVPPEVSRSKTRTRFTYMPLGGATTTPPPLQDDADFWWWD